MTKCSGGTVSVVDGYRIHKITTTETFTILERGYVELLLLAGGGAGGNTTNSGGGGAGGYLYYSSYLLNILGAITVTNGLGSTTLGVNGGNSAFLDLLAYHGVS